MAFISRTDDPIADYNRLEAEQEKRLSRLPRCSQCDCYIQEETAIYIEGEYICDECLEQFRRVVEPEY